MDQALPQGREFCPRCAVLEERVRELEQRLAELEDRLRANSSNSSTAPSSNPLWAPKLKPKKPTGNKPGGRRGHRGHHRTLLPVQEVDEVIEHRPKVCRHCQSPLPEQTPGQLGGRHQVAELPPRAVIVSEHQSYTCRCPRCGQSTTAAIPPEIRRGCTGPRLSAALCYLSAFVHGSRRAVGDLSREVLGLPLSLGTVMNREAEMSAALKGPYAQVQEHVRQAPAKNVDETGWKRAGRWLWLAATPTAALFHIDRGRNWHGLQKLLGELIRGTVCSDRYGVYDRLKLSRRAVCWAHLKRDFQRWVDRGGATVWLGQEGLAITAEVFGLWHRFRSGQLLRRELRRLLVPPRRRMRQMLRRGMDSAVTKVKHFCRNLKKVEKAMWTFGRVEGIEPTNNHAERMLRPGVIWRGVSLGSHGQGGCRYVERMLSVIQSLRLRGRSVMAFLCDALTAHRSARPTPVLL